MSMSPSIRSQVSIEAIILSSVLLFGVVVFASAMYLKTTSYSYSLVGFMANQILDKVVERIDTVVFEGDGFSTSLEVDQSILGEDYNISIIGNAVVLDFRKNTISKDLVAKSVTGSISKGRNWVSNQNGTIVIS
jgi:hypothetical protein